MITILLKQIIDLLSGWISSFTQYASDVLEKLELIEEDTSYLPDIKSDCDDIKDNTAAVITPINNIKSNTDAINTSSATTASNTTAIMNQAVTIGTNSGRAAAFAEDCANNTLDIKDKVVTIASDTTQIRADHVVLQSDLDRIYNAIKWSCLDIETTETESEASPLSFNTDKASGLVSLISNILGSQTGSGTPAPDNECPINWLEECNLTVNGTALNIAFNNYVFEGNIDAVSGKLIITKLGLKFTGDASETWANYPQQNGFYKNLTNAIDSNINTALCNYFAIVPNYADFGIRIRGEGDRLFFCHITDNISGVSDITTWKTWLTSNNVYFVGTLLTPLEVSLTANTINSIIGDNVISSDTNGDITVTYKESVKHYLDKHDN